MSHAKRRNKYEKELTKDDSSAKVAYNNNKPRSSSGSSFWRITKSVIRITLFAVLCLYIVFATLLMYAPKVTNALIYLNFVKYPFFMNLSKPETVNIVGARNFYFETPDGQKLGAWHILPAGPHSIKDAVYDDMHNEIGRKRHFDEALLDEGTHVVLYLHGNSGTRAVPHRVELYRSLTSHFPCHVITFDYRGFADSTGSPSADGLVMDARAAFDWIVKQHGVPPSRVFIYGHSLGSGVAAQLARQLAEEGISAGGLILEAAFSSLLGGALTHPMSLPLRVLPGMNAMIMKYFPEAYRTVDNIKHVKFPVLVLHGKLDSHITYDQGEAIYRAKIAADAEGPIRFASFEEGRHNDLWRQSTFIRELALFFHDIV
eukprot:Colp12_sorted_trinity150504_noHs@13505